MSMPLFVAGTQAAAAPMGMLFNARQAKKAYERNVHSYKYCYQWAVEDLKKAGLNPILAAIGGAAGGVFTASAASGNVDGNPVREALDAKLAGSQNRLTNAQESKTKAETKVTKKQERFLDAQLVGQSVTNARQSMDAVLQAYDLGEWLGNNGRKRKAKITGDTGGSSPMQDVKQTVEFILGTDTATNAKGAFSRRGGKRYLP